MTSGGLRATSLSTVRKLGAGQTLSCYHCARHWLYCLLPVVYISIIGIFCNSDGIDAYSSSLSVFSIFLPKYMQLKALGGTVIILSQISKGCDLNVCVLYSSSNDHLSSL